MGAFFSVTGGYQGVESSYHWMSRLFKPEVKLTVGYLIHRDIWSSDQSPQNKECRIYKILLQYLVERIEFVFSPNNTLIAIDTPLPSSQQIYTKITRTLDFGGEEKPQQTGAVCTNRLVFEECVDVNVPSTMLY